MYYNILILDYNRPKESELCLWSIKKHAKFNHKIIYLSNGGEQDYAYSFYKNGLIDKLVLRKNNSGCGLGTRELFNDFDLNSEFVIYVQCDQYMVRDLSESEILMYKNNIKDDILYIDLAANQGGGRYSERAHFINKNTYNRIPNSIGGPGPFANEKWTEESIQNYMKDNNLKFLSASPIVFADNGKYSIREYPCGGQLLMYTDTKQVFIIKPIKKKIDFINISLTEEEWDQILNNKWINGTIPINHRNNTFKVWEKPIEIKDFIT
jgi:hypothetical protein